MQQLRIKAYNPVSKKKEYLDLKPKTLISLVFEANPIGEIDTRVANVSNFIDVPSTPKNESIMDFARYGKSMGYAPYKHNLCAVDVDGIPIYGKGTFFSIEDYENKNYKIKIRSGIATFSNTIKDKSLRDLSEESIPRIAWSVQGAAESYQGNKDVIIPVMDWNVENNPPNIVDGDADTLPEVQVSTLYPAVKFKKLIEAIVGEAGYTIESDVDNDPLYLNTAVLCSHGAASPITENAWSALYAADPFPITNDSFYAWDDSLIQGNFTRTNPTGTPLPYTLYYYFPADGTVRLQLNFESIGGNAMVRVFYYNKEAEQQFYLDFPKSYNSSFTVTGVKDGYVSFLIYNSTGTTTIRDLSLSAIDFQQDYQNDEYPNNDFSVVSNLPDIAQSEVFKQFLFMFGLMMYVDEGKKHIRCYGWDTVMRNKYKRDNSGNILKDERNIPIPLKDWSGKVDARSDKKRFIYGTYGQKSYIKYQPTTDQYDNELVSSGYFEVPNANLEKEKTVIELYATTVEEFTRFGWGDVAKIRYRENSQPQGEIPFTLVYLKTWGDDNEQSPDVIKLNGNKTTYDRDIPIKFAYYAKFYEIRAQELVNRYYSTFQKNVMKKCMVFTEKFLLNPYDLYKFDHSEPIYLRKHLMYFYINKIDYRGRLAEIELVAIRG